MEFNIPTGIRHSLEQSVLQEHSALYFGSGSVDVFATPAMIAFMEKCAMESVLHHLPEGHTTVGTEVNIKHLKATPVGAKVRAESYLNYNDGKKLFFEVHAWDEKGMIGIGTHTRFIVEKNRFIDKLK